MTMLLMTCGVNSAPAPTAPAQPAPAGPRIVFPDGYVVQVEVAADGTRSFRWT